MIGTNKQTYIRCEVWFVFCVVRLLGGLHSPHTQAERELEAKSKKLLHHSPNIQTEFVRSHSFSFIFLLTFSALHSPCRRWTEYSRKGMKKHKHTNKQSDCELQNPPFMRTIKLPIHVDKCKARGTRTERYLICTTTHIVACCSFVVVPRCAPSCFDQL